MNKIDTIIVELSARLVHTEHSDDVNAVHGSSVKYVLLFYVNMFTLNNLHTFDF